MSFAAILNYSRERRMKIRYYQGVDASLKGVIIRSSMKSLIRITREMSVYRKKLRKAELFHQVGLYWMVIHVLRRNTHQKQTRRKLVAWSRSYADFLLKSKTLISFIKYAFQQKQILASTVFGSDDKVDSNVNIQDILKEKRSQWKANLKMNPSFLQIPKLSSQLGTSEGLIKPNLSSSYKATKKRIQALLYQIRSAHLKTKNFQANPRGLDYEQLKMFFEEKNEFKLKLAYFTSWKRRLLKTKLTQELELYHQMFISKMLFHKSKGRQIESHQNMEEISRIHHVTGILKKTFGHWLNRVLEKKQIDDESIAAFNKFCFIRRLKKAANANAPIRKHYRLALLKRFTMLWKKNINSIKLLKRVFTLFINRANEAVEYENANRDHQLKQRLFDFLRDQVIENENTKQQKIMILTALNHRKIYLRSVCFLNWKKLISSIKGFRILLPIIQRRFSHKYLRKWLHVAKFDRNKVELFIEERNHFERARIFTGLKKWVIQERILQLFQKKILFARWKSSHYFSKVYPTKFYNFKLMKKALLSFKGYFEKVIWKARKTIRSARVNESRELRLKKLVFNELKKSFQYSHEIEQLNSEFLKYHYRYILKANFKKWKEYRYYRHLKRHKNYLANQYYVQRISKSRKKIKLKNAIFDLTTQAKAILALCFTYLRALSLKKQNRKIIQKKLSDLRRRRQEKSYFRTWYNLHLERKRQLSARPRETFGNPQPSSRGSYASAQFGGGDSRSSPISGSAQKWDALFEDNKAFYNKLLSKQPK
eukprot:TRINITY_DN4916_c0_g1_i7.p1 TRINITY_DN4916_c0_g1~~TRINITY_DN4916_c0_g1_i7.p1  ORF type:complete len:767 (+),score=84.20 TRINITY_DN4916_c0_g1_i7:96-2396(+)